MPPFPTESEKLASINAIINGDTKQLRFWFEWIEDLEERTTKVEESYGVASNALQQSAIDIDQVSVPGDEARAPEIRESVVEIAHRLNALISRLKGE